MRLASLVDAGRTPVLPLLIELEGAGSIQLLSLLRVLPGQRYVGRAQWQGREVLAKLLDHRLPIERLRLPKAHRG